MRISRPLLASLAALGAAACGLAAPAHAQAQAPSRGPDPAFATFTPQAATSPATIDYDVWDEAVRNIVVSMGPSLRQTAGLPPTGFGTRRQYGHTSRYRLEGSRVTFSFLDAEILANLGQYRKELQSIGDKVDIQSLGRNEQLAFWINLHNVALVERIGNAWPIRQPRKQEIDGVLIDEDKFITVEGVALSPRDIREKIVFANWSDPRVIYGFWRGDIGGPSIQREAFTGENVSRLLDRSAIDFVNSLRGTQAQGSELQVSTLYEEVAPFYFPDFEADVRAHVARFASDEVLAILKETSRIDAVIEEYDIADLAGGVREPTYQNIGSIDGTQQSFRIPRAMTALLAQREEKFRRIIEQGRTGTVTFSELKLPGDEEGEESEIK